MEVNRSHKFDRANRFSMYGTTPGKLPFDGVPGPAYDPNFNTELKYVANHQFLQLSLFSISVSLVAMHNWSKILNPSL